VVGEARVAFREQLPIEQLWKCHASHAAIEREEFDEYYEGSEEGVAFGLEDVIRYRKSVPLSVLRDAAEGFRPPQSYMRVSALIEALVQRFAPYPSNIGVSGQHCVPAL
jgi:predicted transcriptional regulator